VEKKNTIQLLLVSPSENDAVEITNSLRNSGLALRQKIVTDLTSYADAIDKKVYDIILFKQGIAHLDIATLLKVLKSNNKNDALVIFIGNNINKEEQLLLKQGFHTTVVDDNELIVAAVKQVSSALKVFRCEQVLSQQLKDSEKRCLQLIDSSHDAIAYIHEGMHILSNDPYYKMFAYESRDDIEAMPIMDLVASKDTAKLKEFLREHENLATGKASADELPTDGTLKVNGIKEDGTEFQIKMEFQPATMEGEACLQLIIRNDSISQKELKKLSSRCQETGLYNRSYFLEKLEKTVEYAIDNNVKSYLFFIVIDKFYDIKEKLGDIDSDRLIVDIAHLMKNNISDQVFLARFESYRFSAIISTMDQEHALQAAEKIRKAVDNHIIDVTEKSITITCSIGITQIDSSSGGAQNILTEVQKASNKAINKGGNKIHLHVPDANDMNVRQLGMYWYNEINNAIKQKRMFLVFQPFVSLSGENSENFEIFMRLRNEKGDTIFPREFLTPIESSNFSLHIDRWLVAEAIKTLAEQYKIGNRNRFIIKLTTASLNDDKFMPWVTHNLKRYKVKAKSLIFQIVVTQAADNLRQTQTLAKQLHKLGSQLSIDRFSDNKEIFALLKHVKVDFLKLDNEMVKDISTQPDKLSELTELCAKANKLDIKTIVPYVEEASSLTVVWQSGADYIQGAFLQEASQSLEFDFSGFA